MSHIENSVSVAPGLYQRTCCVCGEGAGHWKQHWNRDTGFGICPSCIAEQSSITTPEEIEDLYGKVGINYDQPMVRHMGKRYRVLATTRKENLANAFMERTPGAAVLKVFDDGLIIIADKTDEGTPI